MHKLTGEFGARVGKVEKGIAFKVRHVGVPGAFIDVHGKRRLCEIETSQFCLRHSLDYFLV